MINRKNFSFKTVHQIGIQLLTLLEQIHSIGYIYNDLKPDNICIGTFNDQSKLHKLQLIDFGLATPYLVIDENREQKHIKEEHKDFQGNLAFSSKNAFKEITLSRRDDLISVIYMLIYLATGDIPFVSRNKSLED